MRGRSTLKRRAGRAAWRRQLRRARSDAHRPQRCAGEAWGQRAARSHEVRGLSTTVRALAQLSRRAAPLSAPELPRARRSAGARFSQRGARLERSAVRRRRRRRSGAAVRGRGRVLRHALRRGVDGGRNNLLTARHLERTRAMAGAGERRHAMHCLLPSQNFLEACVVLAASCPRAAPTRQRLLCEHVSRVADAGSSEGLRRCRAALTPAARAWCSS